MKTSTQLMLAGLGLGVTAFVLYKGAGKAAEAAKSVGHAINPTNPDNVFAGSVNKVGAMVANDDSWTLGGWIYDLTHDAYDPNARPTSSQTPSQQNYTRPPSQANASSPDDIGGSLSFYGAGSSFKDLAADGAVNPFSLYQQAGFGG